MKINILADRLTWTVVDGTDTRITRVDVEADNGATGRLIWANPGNKPRFSGESMNATQLLAGKKCESEVNLARLNKAASVFDIYLVLTEAGWTTITPG